jgi:hypothetical protein
MNINSYNITDVTYHYIGLRVLDGMPPTSKRTEQTEAIASNVLKFVSDRNQRLMVAAPGTTYQGTAKKICTELEQFRFVKSQGKSVGGRYDLTESGRHVLHLMAENNTVELRRLMARIHLQTYDNLRTVVQNHIGTGPVWRPIEVKAGHVGQAGYLETLLAPALGGDAASAAATIRAEHGDQSPSKIRDVLHGKIIEKFLPNQRMGVANFRGICARLATLRLLNLRRATFNGCEFYKTYSPCVVDDPPRHWYTPLDVPLPDGETYRLLFCEPDMAESGNQDTLLDAIDNAMLELTPIAGYHDIPDVRDTVCENLRIPEAEFDDGLNRLLDRTPSPLSVGFHYEKISPNRKPLVHRQTNQLHNLIRRQ